MITNSDYINKIYYTMALKIETNLKYIGEYAGYRYAGYVKEIIPTVDNTIRTNLNKNRKYDPIDPTHRYVSIMLYTWLTAEQVISAINN